MNREMGMGREPEIRVPRARPRRLIRCLIGLSLLLPLNASGTLVGRIEGSAELGLVLGSTPPLPLAKVQITLIYVDQDRKKVELTDKAGEYRFVNLPLGAYEVKAHRDGFRVLSNDAVKVRVNVDQTKVVIPPFRLVPVGSIAQTDGGIGLRSADPQMRFVFLLRYDSIIGRWRIADDQLH